MNKTKETESVLEVVCTTKSEVTTPVVETPVKIVLQPRRSGRVIEPPEWFQNEIFILGEDEPAHYKQVMAAPISKEWLKAMQYEMESM